MSDRYIFGINLLNYFDVELMRMTESFPAVLAGSALWIFKDYFCTQEMNRT